MINVTASNSRIDNWIHLGPGTLRRFHLSEADNVPGREAEGGVARIEVQDEHFQLRRRLVEVVVERAELSLLRTESERTREELVLKCRQCLRNIIAFQSEWMEFLRRLVRIDVTRVDENHDADDRLVDDAVNRCLDDIFSRTDMQPLAISSPVTAEVVSREIDEAWDICVAALEQCTENLVERMISQLDALVGLGVCGLVTRYPNQVCRYFYGYRQLDIKIDKPNLAHETQRGVPAIDGYRIKYTTKRVVTANVRPVIVVRTHHLMHVTETDIHGGFVAIPEFQQSVMRCVPEWLGPMTRLIEGTLIGEQVVRKEGEEHQVRQEEVIQIRYHNDPAITLGQYVLTGWGPRELGRDVDEEMNASEEDSTVAKSAQGGVRGWLRKLNDILDA
jgi:hypothetical protein